MPISGATLGRRRWLLWLSRACVVLFALALNWHVGHRGLFLFDQSMVFDGGWRVLQGQVPYRDFYMPFGPVTFWLQGAVFWLCGATFSSMVLSATLANGIATACAMRLSQLLFPGLWWTEFIAGVATAIWFQPPFGTLWMEQCAFLLGLLSILAVLQGGRATGRWRTVLFGIGGTALLGALLSKQNAGGLLGFVLAGLILVDALPHWRAVIRNIMSWTAGILVAATAFVAWLLLFSDPVAFRKYFFEIALALGRERVDGVVNIARTLSFHSAPYDAYLVSLFVFFVGSGLLGLTLWKLRFEQAWVRSVRTSAYLAVGLTFCQNLFAFLTENEPANCYPYAGVCLALVGAAAFTAVGRLRFTVEVGGEKPAPIRLPKWSVVAITSLLALATSAMAMRDAWRRVVQQFDRDTTFTEKLRLSNASLFWGQPTWVAGPGGPRLRKEDFEAVYRHLKARGKRFFVFGDSTILYGLTGQNSPQPLLYFLEGQTFRESDIAWLDPLIVRSLARNHVELLVIETASYMDIHATCRRFSHLAQWMKTGFTPTATYGNYEIWEADGGEEAHADDQAAKR